MAGFAAESQRNGDPAAAWVTPRRRRVDVASESKSKDVAEPQSPAGHPARYGRDPVQLDKLAIVG